MIQFTMVYIDFVYDVERYNDNDRKDVDCPLLHDREALILNAWKLAAMDRSNDEIFV